MNDCSIDGCESPPGKIRRGFCNRHYARFRKHGTLFIKTDDIFTYFKSKISNEGLCWVWSGSKNSKGYGFVYYQGESHHAHRFSYEYYIGKIPVGMFVCHHCDNPSCVNPNHLFVGSHKDNMIDMVSKNRHVGCRKLNKNKVLEIKALIKNRVKYKQIANIYGVSESAIGNIACGINWK